MRKIIQFLLISFLLMGCESGLRNLEHPPFKTFSIDPIPLTELANMTSVPGIETVIIFVNESKSDTLLYWVDYEGDQIDYGILHQNEYVVQPTYSGHVWLINQNGRNLALYRAIDRIGVVVIE